MDWINVRLSSLRGPEYLGSSPVERATWWQLLAYCAEVENGGRVCGARLWKDRQWQQTCAVTLREVRLTDKLLSWDGDDLLVWNYPLEKQEQVIANREAGRLGGMKRTAVKAETARQNGVIGGRPKPKQNPSETQAPNPSENPTEEEGNRNRKGITPKPPPLVGVEASDEAQRMAAIFHRRPGTKWSEKEVAAFRKLLHPIDSDHLAMIEERYAAQWPPRSNINTLRHDLFTFLNNFSTEVDRARAWKATNGNGKPAETCPLTGKPYREV